MGFTVPPSKVSGSTDVDGEGTGFGRGVTLTLLEEDSRYELGGGWVWLSSRSANNLMGRGVRRQTGYKGPAGETRVVPSPHHQLDSLFKVDGGGCTSTIKTCVCCLFTCTYHGSSLLSRVPETLTPSPFRTPRSQLHLGSNRRGFTHLTWSFVLGSRDLIPRLGTPGGVSRHPESFLLVK